MLNPPDDEYIEKIRQQAKREVFDEIEDILESYRDDYFKININKFNKLKKKGAL